MPSPGSRSSSLHPVSWFNSLSLVLSGLNNPSLFLIGYYPQPCLHLSSLCWEGSNLSPPLTQWNPELNKLYPYHGIAKSEKKKNSETISSLLLHIKL